MAPPSLNPQPMGTGQPQQSLPNMGSPFAQQNPSQSTNPFIGNSGTNNASNSPFATGDGTAGFKNPFSSDHSGAGNPFGGGSAGGGVKGLIESNNKLIQAINKLATIFEKVSQKIGQGGIGNQGGMGGFGVGGGMAGGIGGIDPLQAAQMRKLASGGMGINNGLNAPNAPTFNTPTGTQTIPMPQSVAQTPTGSGQTMQGAMQDAYDRDMTAQRARQRSINRQAGGFLGTGYGGGTFQPHYDENGLITQQEFNQQQFEVEQQRTKNRQNFRNNVADAAKNTFNFGANIGSTGTMQGMLSQIPYIGGLLSIPYATLENRINQFAPAESTARLVAQQGGLGQGGNYFATHAAMFDRFKLLGLDPNAALQEALSFQESSGVMTGMDPMNIMGSRLSAFVGAGFTGQTVGSFQRLNRKDKMLSFDPAKIFNYGLELGLGDQGQMELLGAFEGIQQMIPGMGYRGNASRVLGQIANNTNNGFIGTQGVLQAQRQIQGTAEAGRGLKGIFGGLLETMTMADMLVQSGGDISKAIRNFESNYATDPSALKGTLTKRFGKTVTEMGYLANMTSADYDNIGQGQFAQGTLPAADLGDIVLSKTLVGQQIDRGNDLYKNRLDPANKLLELNAKLEQTIINGVSTTVLDNVGKPLIDLAKNMQDMAKNLSNLLGYVIKGVDMLAKFLAWATSIFGP